MHTEWVSCCPFLSVLVRNPYRVIRMRSLTVMKKKSGMKPWFDICHSCRLSFSVHTLYKAQKNVKRPIHPFPSVKEIVQSIPAGTRYFEKMGAVHGYFQLALDDRSSKITTFLPPSGRFCYLRAPMGLSSSSDEWCLHSDRVLENCKRHTCVGGWIIIIAGKCQELNIVLSKKKFAIGTELPFAVPRGLSQILSESWLYQNFRLLRTLRVYNQLSGFIPNFAHMTVKLRELTTKKNAFLWLEDHQKEFQDVKTLLTSDMIVTRPGQLWY